MYLLRLAILNNFNCNTEGIFYLVPQFVDCTKYYKFKFEWNWHVYLETACWSTSIILYSTIFWCTQQEFVRVLSQNMFNDFPRQ